MRLHRRGPLREDPGSRIGGVSHQIDRDIDLAGAQEIGDRIVSELVCVDEVLERPLQPFAHR